MTAAAAKPLDPEDVAILASPRAMEIDPSRFTTFPMLPASALVTFADKLLLNVPADAHPLELDGAEQIRKDMNVLKGRIAQNVQAIQTFDVRKHLDRLIALWGAAHDRARASAETEESGAEFEAARFVVMHLFPTRVDFTRMGAMEVIGESEARVEILSDPEVREAFDLCVGQVFRARIKEALLDLKQAVGSAAPKVSKKAPGKFVFAPKAPADVAGAMTELRISIVHYAQRVIGLHDPRKPETVERMWNALAAIDAVKREWKPVKKGNGNGHGLPPVVPAEETSPSPS